MSQKLKEKELDVEMVEVKKFVFEEEFLSEETLFNLVDLNNSSSLITDLNDI
jgi:hypothetical protein